MYNFCMKTIVRKWGNSLGLRLPVHIAKELGLTNGSELQVTIDGTKIIIKPAQSKLQDLVAAIDLDCIPEVIDWGGPVGKEIW